MRRSAINRSNVAPTRLPVHALRSHDVNVTWSLSRSELLGSPVQVLEGIGVLADAPYCCLRRSCGRLTLTEVSEFRIRVSVLYHVHNLAQILGTAHILVSFSMQVLLR